MASDNRIQLPDGIFWQLIYAGPIVRLFSDISFLEKENVKEATATM